ncbi:MAG: hypothetical protein HFF50_00210 [Lawsonibacter sp.]|nr:hypothetical protein [Lawsonibacter sp.]
MWTSKRSRRPQAGETQADMGVVTLGGDPAGVLLGGERRWLPVYSPGGYSWRPGAGDRVLVVKAGGERESPCIVGAVQQGGDLRPGEVRLDGGEGSLFLGQEALELKKGGCTLRLEEKAGELSGGGSSLRAGSRLELNGDIYVNGQTLKSYIKQLILEVLAELSGG